MNTESVNSLETADEQAAISADRRDFLKMAGVVAAVGVLPLNAASAGTDQSTQGSNTRQRYAMKTRK